MCYFEVLIPSVGVTWTGEERKESKAENMYFTGLYFYFSLSLSLAMVPTSLDRERC